MDAGQVVVVENCAATINQQWNGFSIKLHREGLTSDGR